MTNLFGVGVNLSIEKIVILFLTLLMASLDGPEKDFSTWDPFVLDFILEYIFLIIETCNSRPTIRTLLSRLIDDGRGIRSHMKCRG